MATLERFMRTGELGPVVVGMTRQEVIGLLGAPGGESVSRHPQIVKYGGLQLALLEVEGVPERRVHRIGLYYDPCWEAIPELVRPTDFQPTATTSIDEMRTFLTSSGIQIHSTVESDDAEHLVLENGVRITFDEGRLQGIAFARKTDKAKKQVSVPIPLETWSKVQELARRSNRSIPDLCAEWIARTATELQHDEA